MNSFRSMLNFGPLRSSALAAACAMAFVGCGEDEPAPVDAPLLTHAELESEFVEVLPCRLSHDHELRAVRVVANELALPLYRDCVVPGEVPCDAPFPVGAMLVKYEYDGERCDDEFFVDYTASIRLEEDSYSVGHDWRWLRLDADLKIVEDGAPTACLTCHINHCGPPIGVGHELRCTPD